MKSILLSFLFLVGAVAYSFGQYPDCTIYVTNMTGDDLAVGVQTVTETPNNCSVTMTSIGPLFVPNGAIDFPINLGTAVLPDPAIRPFRVGCYEFGTGLGASWQINECWNPACITSDETAYDIQFTMCGDYESAVTIF